MFNFLFQPNEQRLLPEKGDLIQYFWLQMKLVFDAKFGFWRALLNRFVSHFILIRLWSHGWHIFSGGLRSLASIWCEHSPLLHSAKVCILYCRQSGLQEILFLFLWSAKFTCGLSQYGLQWISLRHIFSSDGKLFERCRSLSVFWLQRGSCRLMDFLSFLFCCGKMPGVILSQQLKKNVLFHLLMSLKI